MRQGRPPAESHDEGETRTSVLMVIVALLVVGGAWLLSGLLVPFFLAMILAIAISPVANRLERLGLPQSLASLLCLLAVVSVLVGTTGLVVVQAGGLLQDADRYVTRFSEILTTASKKTGGDKIMESLEVIDGKESPRKAPSANGKDSVSDSGSAPGKTEAGEPTESKEAGESTQAGADKAAGSGEQTNGVKRWTQILHRGLLQVGTWFGSGLGGLLGALGGAIVFLAYFFYMLETRDEWVERLTAALRHLGLHPSPAEIAKIQTEIVAYFGCVSLVALSYVIVVSLALWAIGVPQFLLWGILAGLMELVPYFGPLIASMAPTIVALSLDAWWQPALVALLFLVLNFMESYVVAPLFYGKRIQFNPVTILFGTIFFGWIWGPMGLALAIPMMIILRSLLAMTPDTPTLNALADMEEPDDADEVTNTAGSTQ